MDPHRCAGAFLGPRGTTLPMAILRGAPPHVHAAVWRAIERGGLGAQTQHLCADDDEGADVSVVTCDNYREAKDRCTPQQAAALMGAVRDAAAANGDSAVSFELVWPTTLAGTLRGPRASVERVFDTVVEAHGASVHLCSNWQCGRDGDRDPSGVVEWDVDCSNYRDTSRCCSVRVATELMAALRAAAERSDGVTFHPFVPPALPLLHS